MNHSLLLPKVLFSFDGEYSVVALDFDVAGRKSKVDARAVETKKEIEAITGLKFAFVSEVPFMGGYLTQVL